MTTKTLYKNGSAIGPTQAEGSVEYGKRLIADDGYILKNGDVTTSVIDVCDGTEANWTEEIAPIEDWTTEELAEAGRILLGAEEVTSED